MHYLQKSVDCYFVVIVNYKLCMQTNNIDKMSAYHLPCSMSIKNFAIRRNNANLES